MAGKDTKAKDDAQPPAEEAPAAAEAPPAEELGPFHGLEPTWVREALTDILERVTRLEGKR